MKTERREVLGVLAAAVGSLFPGSFAIAEQTPVESLSGKEAVSGSLVYGFIQHLDGVVVRFHVPGSKQTIPEGINAAGKVTGYYLISAAKDTYAAFVRSPDGTIKTFDVTGGFPTMPVGINARGVVAGSVLSSQTTFFRASRRT